MKIARNDQSLNKQYECVFLDFFNPAQDSRRFVEFLQQISPCKYKTSQKLVSHDINNSTYNYKQTYKVELPAVCKDDLIVLDKQTASKLGFTIQI